MKKSKTSKLFSTAAVLAALLVAFNLIGQDTKAYLKYHVASTALQPVLYFIYKYDYFPEIILKKYDNSSQYRYWRMMMSQEWFDKIQAFEAKPDDVFVATFPKSGTHLMGQMVTQVVHEGNAEFQSIHEYITGLEFEQIKGARVDNCGYDALTVENTRDSKKPGVFVTHLAQVHTPYHPKAKYIVMMRNPVDVLASGRKMMEGKIGTRLVPPIESIYKMLFEIELSWYQFHLDWWKLRNEPNVLFLFYEDALKNLTKTVLEVTEFLEKPVDAETLERVTYKSTIGYMKPNAEKFDPPHCVQMMPLEPPKAAPVMINKGKAGKGKLVVPREIREKIKQKYHQAFENTDFPLWRYENTIV